MNSKIDTILYNPMSISTIYPSVSLHSTGWQLTLPPSDIKFCCDAPALSGSFDRLAFSEVVNLIRTSGVHHLRFLSEDERDVESFEKLCEELGDQIWYASADM
jgi:hypothetical protein